MDLEQEFAFKFDEDIDAEAYLARFSCTSGKESFGLHHPPSAPIDQFSHKVKILALFRPEYAFVKGRNALLRTILTLLRVILTLLRTILTLLRTILTLLRVILTLLRTILTLLRVILTLLRAILTLLRAILV